MIINAGEVRDNFEMRTLADIEARSDEIKVRLNEILEEISQGPVPGRNDLWEDLAEEMAHLLIEAKVLNTSIIYAREMAEHLMSEPCHGPH